MNWPLALGLLAAAAAVVVYGFCKMVGPLIKDDYSQDVPRLWSQDD